MSLRRFTYPFRYVPTPEIQEAAQSLIAEIDASPELKSIFSEGKMLGVMVCEDPKSGSTLTLRAFSGLAGGRSILPGFVPPIFDTTTVPSLWTNRSAIVVGTPAPATCATLGTIRGGTTQRSGVVGSSECETVVGVGVPTPAERSADLQDWLFRQYRVKNGLGEEEDIKEVFAQRGIVPPGGTGECAGPKLLDYAYRNGLSPISMGEFWYGASPKSGEVREHGRFYPSCTGKCGPLMTWMLQGIEVEPNPLQRITPSDTIKFIYEDEAILVVSKPSGMLCVPGLTGTESMQEILEHEHGKLYSCHRLDMDTSGVMVFAKTLEAQVDIQQQFENRETEKTYLAHLCAGSRPWKGKKKGTIALPLAPDWYDRPRQMVDKENGKKAITEFEILEVFPDGEMDVRFTPRTGRTHQLRVHAASPLGLGRPIKGDALYGAPSEGRLELHAESLSFNHPVSGKRVTFKE